MPTRREIVQLPKKQRNERTSDMDEMNEFLAAKQKLANKLRQLEEEAQAIAEAIGGVTAKPNAGQPAERRKNRPYGQLRAQVIAFVTDHSGCTAREIADALGIRTDRAANEAEAAIARTGLIVKRKADGRVRFYVANGTGPVVAVTDAGISPLSTTGA
jgi:hypothetical protein